MADVAGSTTPDLNAGVPVNSLGSATALLGRVARTRSCWYARGPILCGRSSLHALPRPLAEGLVVGDTVRCPLHHACFSLATGEALRAPALDPIACWRVERRGDVVFVREKISEPPPRRSTGSGQHPSSIVIVGAAPLAWRPRTC